MKHYRRDFLNKKEGNAHIVSASEMYIHGKNKDIVSLRCEFTVADCNRIVSLDFDCHSTEDVDNALHKIDLIIKHAELIRDAILSVKDKVHSKKRRAAILKAEEDDAFPF